jgi:DNA-3-methyladenine glycosylase II
MRQYEFTAITADSLPMLCDTLAQSDNDLALILHTYGYPPFWDRPNTYETLVHIILEQQVSLASARAALEKLRAKVGEITPENVSKLSDEELREAYFSRQKAAYVKHLTQQILDKHLNLRALEGLPNDKIRETLIKLNGVGNWTVDVYLILVLHRADFFPLGDIAAVNALKDVKHLPKDTPRERIVAVTEQWKPYRTVATMMLWHHYLSSRARNARI